jgi:hypothetical protein
MFDVGFILISDFGCSMSDLFLFRISDVGFDFGFRMFDVGFIFDFGCRMFDVGFIF